MPILDETRQLLKTGRVAAQIATAVTTTAALAGGLGIGIAGYSLYQFVTGSSMISDFDSWLTQQRLKAMNTSPNPNPKSAEEIESLGIFFPFNKWVSWLP